MHPKIRKSINKISDFINRPLVRGVSKFSGSILQTMHLMKDRSPVSIAVASFSIVSSLAESFDLPQTSPLESYIKSNNLNSEMGMLPKLIYLSKYYVKCNRQVVFSSEEEDLIEIHVDDNNKFYITEFNNQSQNISLKGSAQKVSEDYYYSKDFNFDLLFDELWKYYSSGIFLKRNRSSYDLELSAVPDEEPIYIGNQSTDEFYMRLRRAMDSGISRSFLLEGPPGTGKSSFALKIARTYFKRTVRLDPHVTRGFESGELEFFVSQLKPEVIIFEDFDRAFNFADVALSMLENIKKRFPHLVIFGTVNDLDKLDPALVRPGRFDKIINIGCPGEEHRKEILKLYFGQYGVEISDAMISVIANESVKLTPIYLKELAIESRNLDKDNFIKEMSELIDEFNQRILRASPELDEDEDEEDEEHILKEFISEVADGITPSEIGELKEYL